MVTPLLFNHVTLNAETAVISVHDSKPRDTKRDVDSKEPSSEERSGKQFHFKQIGGQQVTWVSDDVETSDDDVEASNAVELSIFNLQTIQAEALGGAIKAEVIAAGLRRVDLIAKYTKTFTIDSTFFPHLITLQNSKFDRLELIR